MSTLYIRLPSKAVAGNAQQLTARACPFAQVSNTGVLEREGVAELSNLSETIARMQRVVVLLAGSDVTLLRVKTPPLSASRLKAALPNLVEERLLGDPSDCVIVAGGLADGLRTIAVAQRVWLELLKNTFIGFGARHVSALPAQSCLSGQAGIVTAAVSEYDTGIDLTLRLSEHDGIGLTIDSGADQTAAHDVIQTLCTVAPAMPVTLYVPEGSMHIYRESLAGQALPSERISISPDNWMHWIAGARDTALDLAAGTNTNTRPGYDWRSWRWPLVLGSAVLLVNVGALNIDWWHMKSEADSLRSSMTQIYKSAYPNESVIIDPIAQMQQKITSGKRKSGMSAADDFTSIVSAFGEAWTGVKASLASPPAIAALEYRDKGLLVRFKPGGEGPTQQMNTALAERGLSLEPSTEQSAVVWKIRSIK